MSGSKRVMRTDGEPLDYPAWEEAGRKEDLILQSNCWNNLVTFLALHCRLIMLQNMKENILAL